MIVVEGVGTISFTHNLVNCLHDGKERTAYVQEIVKEEARKGNFLKPNGFGVRDKVSTATCCLCLINPKLHDTVRHILSAKCCICILYLSRRLDLVLIL